MIRWVMEHFNIWRWTTVPPTQWATQSVKVNSFCFSCVCIISKFIYHSPIMIVHLLLLCKRLLYQCNIYSLFRQSPYFYFFLPFSRLFHSLPLAWDYITFALTAYLRPFYFHDIFLHCISDSRMFFNTILTWSIRNAVSVLWKLLFIVLPRFTKLLLKCSMAE